MIDTAFWLEVIDELDNAANDNLELYHPDKDGCYSKEQMLDIFTDGVEWIKKKIQKENL